jgi:predicted hotdog family 3-hydroxylacyl-ACP dehydratase
MTEVLTQPMIEGAAISALIPQKSPIEMVDKLWFNDETTTVSGFTVKEDNIFCKDGYFNEPGIIENIAQTAAIRAGYMASLLMKDGIPGEPPVGYIGAIKKLVIHQLPKAGSELKTEIIVQQVVFDVTLISGRSTVDGEPVAECEMKIFLKR